mmetsp:Transcript_148747/g.259878  ORF Transcript_148747/g.259878 Transcript_148747/m.259878 type:complete len:534 (-) Transcript_148747:150-1751(-)
MARLRVVDVHYIRQHNIPGLFNDMALHVLNQRAHDPITELLEYLESRLGDEDYEGMDLSHGSLTAGAIESGGQTSKRAEQRSGAAAAHSGSSSTFMHTDEKVRRQKIWRHFFDIWDLDSNGYIDYQELQQMVLSLQALSGKNERKILLRMKAELQTQRRSLEMTRDTFVDFMCRLSDGMDAAQFELVHEKLSSATSGIIKGKHGAARKQAIWSLFQRWDLDDNGQIDFPELVKVIAGVPIMQQDKYIRKETLKWQARLQEENRHNVDEVAVLTITEFHNFLASLFERLPEEQFPIAAAQIRDQIESLRREPKEPPVRPKTPAEERDDAARVESEAAIIYWNKMFSAWDLDGSGSLDTNELEMVLSRIEAGSTRGLKKAMLQAQTGARTSGTTGNIDRALFITIMGKITRRMSSDEMIQFQTNLQEALDAALNETKGSKKKYAIWKLFCQWDADSNGSLDWTELRNAVTQMSNAPSKRVRSKIAKWQHKLAGPDLDDCSMDLSSFHSFMEDLFGDVPDSEFFQCIEALKSNLAK